MTERAKDVSEIWGSGEVWKGEGAIVLFLMNTYLWLILSFWYLKSFIKKKGGNERDVAPPQQHSASQALSYLLYEKANYVVHCLFERVFASYVSVIQRSLYLSRNHEKHDRR